MVGLHEHADGEVVISVAGLAGRRTDAALEVVADHPRAAADGALGDGTGGRRGVRRLACAAVTWKPSTSLSVPSQVSATTGSAHASTPSHLGDLDLDQRVADDADAVGVGDADGGVQEADLLDPGQAGHLAVAVEAVVRRVDRVAPHVALVGDHDRHARADVVALDDRRVPDPHAGHVGDRVVLAGLEGADDDAELARPHDSSALARWRWKRTEACRSSTCTRSSALWNPAT